MPKAKKPRLPLVVYDDSSDEGDATATTFVPGRLNETEYLARELLEEVSWTAVRPDLMPV